MKSKENLIKFSVRKITFTALFISLGILFPQIFHMAGGPEAGEMFLPMHIPVLLAGMVLGPVSGGVAGAVTPVISCLLTGMPKLPVMPFMVLELAVYGSSAGLLYINMRRNVYVSLIGAMAAGRIIKAAALAVFAYLFGLNVPPVISVLTAAAAGAAGILVQLIFVPVIAVACRKVVQKYVHN